jgi:hypothetical protein
METKRRWILRVLLAFTPLAAIESQTVPATIKKYQNGQCPICRTTAESYTGRVACVTPKVNLEYSRGCLPPPRLVRCSICSAAFYQDAEK